MKWMRGEIVSTENCSSGHGVTAIGDARTSRRVSEMLHAPLAELPRVTICVQRLAIFNCVGHLPLRKSIYELTMLLVSDTPARTSTRILTCLSFSLINAQYPSSTNRSICIRPVIMPAGLIFPSPIALITPG